MTLSIISDPYKYHIGKSGTYYNKKYFEVIEGKIYLKNSKDQKDLDDLANFKDNLVIIMLN